MAKIKTRDAVKSGVKAIDKAAVAGERMKREFIRTKAKAERSVYAAEDTPEEYAGDRVEYAGEEIPREAAHRAASGTKSAVRHGKEAFQKRRAKKAEQRAAEPPQAEPPDVERPYTRRPIERRQRYDEPPQAPGTKAADGDNAEYVTERGRDLAKRKAQDRAAEKSRRPVAASIRYETRNIPVDMAKSKNRRCHKGVRQTERIIGRTARNTVKTAETSAAAKAAQTTAQAANRTVRAAYTAAKAAADSAKAAMQAVRTAIKATITATQELVTALVAGGWIAMLVVVVICLIGLIIGSSFGIFFSGEDSGTGQTVRTAVQEIDREFENRIETIKAGVSYDMLELSGSHAAWKEILAVYAVKTATVQEIASMNNPKKALLTDVFWQMNQLSSYVETTPAESEDESDTTTLYITVTHKTADEMADLYGFTAEQREQLAALLAGENNSLWSFVLYGIGTGDGEIVVVALSQIGNLGGEPYWSWYGFTSRVEWCACFVSWCANEYGYIDTGVIPKFAGCVGGVTWFQGRGLWQDNSYEPRPGDIIFFDWDNKGSSGPQDGSADHVGIVEKVENGTVCTVEGNSSDGCRERSYAVGHYEVLGYGTPAY